MFESFMVALNAVAPFLILLSVGFLAVRTGLTDRAFMARLNALNFRLFFPFLMFSNVYSARPEDLPSVTLMIFGPVSVLLLIAVLLVVVPRIVKENPRRGTIIQAVFRSNFIIYGIPLTASVFGTARSSVCGMMVMIMVTLFNTAAVIVLEIFRDGGRIRLKPLLLGLVRNPLLQGCAAGLLCYLLQIRLPDFIASPVSSLSSLATTLAMIALLVPAIAARAGKVVTDSLQSRILGADVKYNVYLPSSFDKTDRQYPRHAGRYRVLSHGTEHGRRRSARRPAGLCQHRCLPGYGFPVHLCHVPPGTACVTAGRFPGIPVSSFQNQNRAARNVPGCVFSPEPVDRNRRVRYITERRDISRKERRDCLW